MNRCILVAILQFLLLLPVVSLQAQTVSGKAGNATSSQTYKKMSGDSVRVRKSKRRAAPGEKRDSLDSKKIRKRKSSVKKDGKVVKVDSVEYKPIQYSLGDRVIMQGDSGRDVRAVAGILVNKLYIDEGSLVYTSDGGVLYDGELVRAVKHFQEFNGFYPDGIVGHELIKALRRKKR